MALPHPARRRRRGAATLSALLASLVFAACTSDSSSGSPPPQRSEATAAAMQLKVMEFNIEYGGEQVAFQGVINAIRAGGASVVAIEEGYGNMPKIAQGLGWPYYDPRTQTVSKYPLLEPPAATVCSPTWRCNRDASSRSRT